jgi:hypothetical protein
MKHACETRRRWLQKDHRNSVLAFMAFDTYYTRCLPNQKRDIWAFIKSRYYNAFLKWADYVIENQISASRQYLDYLIENQIPIDNWTKDYNLEKFNKTFILKESPESGIIRSIEYLEKWAEYNQMPMTEFFVSEHPNNIIHQFKMGRMSPWFLFCSSIGMKWVVSLNPMHYKALEDFLNVDLWNRKIALRSAEIKELKKILEDSGL